MTKKITLLISMILLIGSLSACTKDDTKSESTENKAKTEEQNTTEVNTTNDKSNSTKKNVESNKDTDKNDDNNNIESSNKDSDTQNNDNSPNTSKPSANIDSNTENNKDTAMSKAPNKSENLGENNNTNSYKASNNNKTQNTKKQNTNKTPSKNNIQNNNKQKTNKAEDKTGKQTEDSNDKEENNDNTTENPNNDNSTQEDKVEAYSKNIVYSNLNGTESKMLLKKSLLKARIKEQTIDKFLAVVEDYNKSVGDVGLVESGFKTAPTVKDMASYDVIKIDENWLKNHEEFIGYNCRMTVYMIAHDLITVNGKLDKENSFLFLDQDAMFLSNNELFTEEEINKFNTVFSTPSTDLVKDIDIHLEKYANHLEDKGIKYSNNQNISVISVLFHSDLDNNLFIGHTGILVNNANEKGLLFVEKISFQEPYQMIKFNNRQEVSDYLMAKYDTEHGQPTAKPMILENGKLIEGYRPNPENVEE